MISKSQETERRQEKSYPVFEVAHLIVCERVRFRYDWHDIHFMVKTLHELHINLVEPERGSFVKDVLLEHLKFAH